MINGVGIGALAGGLAQGFGQGYRMRADVEDRRAQRSNQERYLGIAEAGAEMNRKLTEQTLARTQRENEREMRLDAAHKQALQILAQATNSVPDPSLPADQQVSRFVTSGFNDPRVLNAVAKTYAEAGSPEAAKWLERGFMAKREGVLDYADSLARGDTEGAAAAYNRTGDGRITKVELVSGTKGAPDARYRATFADGTTEEHSPGPLLKGIFSFSEWRNIQNEERKAQRETNKDQADIDLKQSQAGYYDRMPGAKASRKGSGSGSGGGGDEEGGDPFSASAKRRVEVQKEVDEYVGRNFGKLDPVDSNKWTHTPESRNLSTIATQLMTASMEGGRPMSMQDAARAAKEGQQVYTYPQLKNGRLVLSQMWEHNGVQYPMGAAEKDAKPEQVLGYIDAIGALARQQGLKAADIMKTDDIKVAAKQAGITPEQAVKRMLEGPPGMQKGQIEPGNIDLKSRKVLNNPDGSISTESSITITESGPGGREIAVNIPTVIGGKRYSDDEARAHYGKTGEHLGKFASIDEAVAAAKKVHEDQGKRYAKDGGKGPTGGIAAEAARAKDLETRLTDLRDKEATIRRSGGDAAGISREIAQAEGDLGGIPARGWKAVRAELDRVNAEIQKLDSGKMRGAPGRYRDTLLRKKAELERRLREESPTSGISREQLR